MWVDAFILIAIILAVYRSWSRGFISQLGGTVGFIAGIFVGRWLEPHTVELAHTPLGKVVVTIFTILGAALLFMTIGEAIGLRIKSHMNGKVLNNIDNSFGTVMTTLSVLLSIWLLAAIINRLPSLNPSIENQLRSSRILGQMNHALPPASTLLSDFGHLINPNGFPDVFIGSEPIPSGHVNLPSLGQMDSAVAADRLSVLRIQGRGCGGIVSGSGFVVGNGLVATNAHVVAGIKNPIAEDSNGNHPATVVEFDPTLDFAVLRVQGLAGKPLALNTVDAQTGTPAAVLGYPGGGQFNASAAAVLDYFLASGRDIYGQGHSLRSVYSIKADVIPGNSGGPLVGQDGRVLGVIFAESTTYPNTGYALTAGAVKGEIQNAAVTSQAVSSGTCAE